MNRELTNAEANIAINSLVEITQCANALLRLVVGRSVDVSMTGDAWDWISVILGDLSNIESLLFGEEGPSSR